MDTYIRQVDLEAVEMDGDWVILHPVDYTVTKINALGDFCWNLLTHKQSVQSLTKEIQSHYDVSVEVAERDVKEFLDKMMNAGLVVS